MQILAGSSSSNSHRLSQHKFMIWLFDEYQYCHHFTVKKKKLNDTMQSNLMRRNWKQNRAQLSVWRGRCHWWSFAWMGVESAFMPNRYDQEDIMCPASFLGQAGSWLSFLQLTEDINTSIRLVLAVRTWPTRGHLA